MVDAKLRAGVLGASGYTGADIVRLGVCHPNIEFSVLTANTHAGKPIASVFPHFHGLDLPDLTTVEEADWKDVDVVFCGLPHGTTQDITQGVLEAHPHVRFVDMSADYRLRDPQTYEQWYGRAHTGMALQGEAVYGLTEHYRQEIENARLVACPGCYPTAALLALLPLLKVGAISAERITIDAKSGVTGAGRSLKEANLFAEAGEGLSPYGVGSHRHMPEIEQELSVAAGSDVTISFTPHLIPMSRGEFLTIYAELGAGTSIADLRGALEGAYDGEP
ncbi:MAG: N-acetyl-gamma-glutamyl-phosphate reductase, partial [Pseudomonadota bacterium]